MLTSGAEDFMHLSTGSDRIVRVPILNGDENTWLNAHRRHREVGRFSIKLIALIVLYTLVAYGAILLLTRSMLIDSLRVKAASYLDLVKTTREWNAGHGGVWVLEREDVRANKYLRQLGVNPETETVDGSTLVLRNPSPMTRELAELTKRRGGIFFRLVSENPLNPYNAADLWEEEALRAIDNGAPWVDTFDETSSTRVYRYIEPLIIDESCLSCHTPARGYSVGMRKGGLSVSIPTAGFDRHMRNLIGMLSALALFTLAVALAVLRAMLKDLRSRLDDANASLHLLATTDALTGVANRRTLLARLGEEFERSRRSERPLSVVEFDLDHFKDVNDVHGHAAGDCALREFVQRTRSVIRAYDVFGRIGGEEFLLIAPDTTTETAAALAERVLDKLRSEPCTACSRIIRMTASAGVAGATPSDEDAETLLSRADHALYEAKRLGRDRVHVAEEHAS